MTLRISTAEIAERFHMGESVPSLAKAFGCHPNTILYRLNTAGARSRTRASRNVKTLLATYKPTLLVLLGQLEKTLTAVRAEFAAEGAVRSNRKKYLDRIARLEAQIEALQALTSKS